MKKAFQPKIAAFLCSWCSHTSEEMSQPGTSKIKNRINVIRVPCLGHLDPVFIMKAFETGADGVLVSGCHPDKCNYKTGNLLARRRWVILKNMLSLAGIEPGRIHFSWVSAAEGARFVEVVNKVTDAVKALGPVGKLGAK
jgi:coenzyme F420-reducing hydrogenase delta subunit